MAQDAAAPPGRLGDGYGLLIERTRPVRFRFEGREFEGLAGDTIASALAANDHWLLSRSFKYRRPRGILSMAGQDANTLVQLPDEPNVLADRAPIVEGLEVLGQNYSGSLERDRGALIERFARFLPVGFYYRTFFRPQGAWRRWEPVIRRRAGLGRVNPDAQSPDYDKAYGFYDVVVVGGGPAGLTAALTAARAGAEVLLVEEWPLLGGALAYARFDAEGRTTPILRRELCDAIAAERNIEVMTDAVCQGWFADRWLPVIRGRRLHRIRARQVIVASGAFEQPIVFRNNDLPGVMLGSAAQRLIRLYGVRPGERAVVATVNEHGYEVALDLLEAGVEVAAVVDLRAEVELSLTIEAVRSYEGVKVLPGHTPFEAVGRRHVEKLRIARVAGEGRCAGPGLSIACDLVCMGAGYAPAATLLRQAGATFRYDEAAATPRLARPPRDGLAAGSVTGADGLQAALAEGRHAGWQAAKSLTLAVGSEPAMPARRSADGVNHPFPIFPHPKGKDFVDFDEDLTVRDIRRAIAEGFDDIELLKRYSTLGMGPSQGRHSNLNAIRLCARATGRASPAVGATTARPPYAAEKLGQLAGRGFQPVRRTAMHHRHLAAGAEMMPAGLWLRPAYYGRPTERAAAIAREAREVRDHVGLIDVSTLGGLDIRGPDATLFLERLYTGSFARQPVGRARYALMCDQTGAIVDDGVACRLHERHFYVTATTTGVDRAYQQMVWWQAQWRLDVDIANVTSAYAAVNLAGPDSRKVLAPLCDLDLTPAAFPYMAVRTGIVAGIRARLFRVGFVGELGFEIHVPAGCGEALWDRLLDAGAEHGLRPFGVEAQRLLRLEKGHLIVGQDTDALTTPDEAQLGWAIGKDKPFFVGQRALRIQAARAPKRRLVGFVLSDPRAPMPEECHLVVRGEEITGRVTSVARSPALDRVIGLAYVAPDQAEVGSALDIKVAGGRRIRAEVAPLPFYDPDGRRQEL